MPTSYTSLLGLALPVTGELSGTWGDTVNQYITQYVDAAVAGAQTISGSQTAVTLSVTNGSSLTQAGAGATGSAQYQIINCTGNPASALTVTVPSASKVYLVLNNTSTNQTVTVKGAATTGVTVAAARCALIAWNGTDFELVATDDASKMNGVLAAANGGTGQSSYTVGDILFASGSTTLSKLADVATGNALISGGVGVAPSYGKIGLTTHVSGTLPIANGGTNGTATPTAGTIAYGTGSAYAFNTAGTSGQPLLSGGSGAPTFGTLSVGAGGTGQTSYTDGQLLIGNTATTSLSKATLTAGSGVTITNGNGSITISATGSGGTVTSVGATSPVASSGGTAPTISLNSAYGDTLNPYGSKTANFFLAAPNGAAGAPTFRAIAAADVPTLNQNTTGTAANITASSNSTLTTLSALSLPGSQVSGNISGNAANVTGVVGVANGGTGLSSTPTNGQLNIGNGTGFTRATLTQGSGITITNGAGSITIAANNSGTVTSVGGTGSVNGITLSGTVTSSGNLTLGGTLSGVSLTTQVTGTLPVANGGTGAATLTANNVLLGNGTSALQVVAPGSNGNVLTSNGTTWVSSAPAAAGGSITATASGAITAGNPVVINSNGTVSAISGAPTSCSIATAPTYFSGSVFNNTTVTGGVVMTYDASIDRVVGITINNITASSTTYPTALVGTPTADGLNFSWVATTITTGTNLNVATPYAIASDGAGTFVATFNSGGVINYSVGTYNSSTNLVTWGTYTTLPIAGSVNYPFAPVVKYMPTPNRWAVILVDEPGGSMTGTPYAMFCNSYTRSGNTLTFSAQGIQTAFSGNNLAVGYGNVGASDNGAVIGMACGIGAISYTIAAFFNVGTSTVTVPGSFATLTTSYGDTGWPSLSYNAAAGAFILFGHNGSGPAVMAITVPTSGTPTPTSGAVTVLESIPVGYNLSKSIAYSPSGRCVIPFYLTYWLTPGNQAQLKTSTVTTSVRTNTVSPAGPLTLSPSRVQSSTPPMAICDTSRGAVTATIYGSDAAWPTQQQQATPIIVNFSGNLTATNFIGFSAGTYANGATATITTVGGTNTAQSGLTVGRAVYMNGNGFLGTGPSVPSAYAGIPLSATSILVKG